MPTIAPENRAVAAQPSERIASARLLLRKAKLADIDDLYELNTDPKVTRWLSIPRYEHRHHYVQHFARFQHKWQRGTEYLWVLEEKHSGKVVGYLCCRRADQTIDLGFAITPSKWGLGYATEAASTLMSALQQQRFVKKIVAICDVRNLASAQVLSKSGLHYRGLATEFITYPDEPEHRYDAYFYALDIG